MKHYHLKSRSGLVIVQSILYFVHQGLVQVFEEVLLPLPPRLCRRLERVQDLFQLGDLLLGGFQVSLEYFQDVGLVLVNAVKALFHGCVPLSVVTDQQVQVLLPVVQEKLGACVPVVDLLNQIVKSDLLRGKDENRGNSHSMAL